MKTQARERTRAMTSILSSVPTLNLRSHFPGASNGTMRTGSEPHRSKVKGSVHEQQASRIVNRERGELPYRHASLREQASENDKFNKIELSMFAQASGEREDETDAYRRREHLSEPATTTIRGELGEKDEELKENEWEYSPNVSPSFSTAMH